MEIEINNIKINDKQAEIFAFNIYRDIGEYLRQHEEDYNFWWIFENINLANILVTVGKGVIEKASYSYQICQYKEVCVL